MIDESKLRDDLSRLHHSLKAERTSWDNLYRDLGEYILPGRMRFFRDNTNRGDVRNNRSSNNRALQAARTLKAGMHSGITSPSRPWFRLTTPDPELAEFGPVKEWLYTVTKRMQTIFHRSNIYNALPNIYGDCATFGTAAAMIYEDSRDLVRAYTYPVGQYYIASNNRGVVDTLVRELSMTARQLEQEFGYNALSGGTKNLIDTNNKEKWIDVIHVVKPNPDYDPESPLPKHKRVLSCYYERACEESKMLRVSGFDESPLLCPRWDLTGDDVYGHGCGIIALGDTKALQLMEKRKAQAIDKIVNPPMIADSSLKRQRVSMLPGAVNYADLNNNIAGMKSVYDINFPVQYVSQEIQNVEQRINSAFFADLFLMLAMTNKNMTATEVAERHEEKLLMLGPVLERLNDELLDPMIDRVFNVMMRNNVLPPPPDDLQGVDLRVEHISIMAQAQKMVATAAVDRFSGFVGQLAGADPSVLDKWDLDQTVDEYADMMGIPANIVRSDEEVQQIRQRRAQQAAAQQAAEQQAMQAKAAKELSQADTSGDNALTDIIQGMTG